MTDWKKVYEVLDRTIEVWEVRDPVETAKRYEHKKQAIKWVIDELKKGPIQGGTLSDTKNDLWTFGTTEWDAVRDAVRTVYEDKCAICGAPAREVHHIRPRFLKGRNHPRNLILLCNECHDEVHRQIDNNIQSLLESSLDISVRKEHTLDGFL